MRELAGRCMGTVGREQALVGGVIGVERSGGDGPLAGVLWVVKDLFDVAGLRTLASSRLLETTGSPATADSAVVRDLSAAGAVLVGKTHLNEFAYGLDGVNAHFGTVCNPQVPGALAGGSSSGSAWAVASGLVPLAVGTDTGGSIRVPAAYCGLYGFRMVPEHPWIRDGAFPLAPRFDTAGWFTWHRRDMAEMLRWLGGRAGAESGDGLSLAAGLPGIAREAGSGELAVWANDTRGLVSAFNILQSSAAYEIHRSWLHPRRVQYDPATWERIARAEGWTDGQRSAAERLRVDWCRRLEEWIAAHGFLVLPTTPGPACRMESGMSAAEREAILAYTAPASLAGHPVLSVPYEVSPGIPSAVQVVLPRSLEIALDVALTVLGRIDAADLRQVR